jgi:hypothetical protein
MAHDDPVRIVVERFEVCLGNQLLPTYRIEVGAYIEGKADLYVAL